MKNPSSKILSPKVSLPKGGGAVQGIGETFQLNPFLGTGNLSIPIPTSSCRGFEPQLSLDYSSGNGNGSFGVGFSLAIPNISRKTAKGTPTYRDEDTFLMSHAEDLVPKLKEDSGSWIPDEDNITEEAINYRITRFRLRAEGLFAKIEKWSTAENDIHWRVTSADNVTSIYGKTLNSRIADPDDPSHVFQWLIDEVQDAKENVISYQYQAENQDNVSDAIHETHRQHTANRYLHKIKYGRFAANQWHFELVFDYGEREFNDPNNISYEPSNSWSQRADLPKILGKSPALVR